MNNIDIKKPYLLFLGDTRGVPSAKTAFGLRDWSPDDCIAQWTLPGCTVDLGLRRLAPRAAAAAGARSMIIAVAPIGGAISDRWLPTLIDALESGLDLVSGLHDRLSDVPSLREIAVRLGRTLHDVRHPSGRFTVASGRKRGGKRLLTVGTDCALGKKYTALALTKALRRRGLRADFRATGQTGIMIAGKGVALDAVVADFVSGAAESLSPDNTVDHWDIVEGQGSLFHPAYAGVTLALVHGTQPDAMVLCHEPGRSHLYGYPDYPVPDLHTAMRRYLEAAHLTNPAAQFAGLSLNTSHLSDTERRQMQSDLEREHGMPCFDPMRDDLEKVVSRIAGIS